MTYQYALPPDFMKSKIYGSWRQMKYRCERPTHAYYDRYGGRGIRICEAWSNDFSTFYHWAVDQWRFPDDHKTHFQVRRYDRNGDYKPTNCYILMEDKHSYNNRHFYEYKGQKLTLHEICDLEGAQYPVVYSRVKRGWDLDVALYVPVHKYTKKVKDVGTNTTIKVVRNGTSITATVVNDDNKEEEQ